MKYSERIYIQENTNCLRNKDIIKLRCSSDYCVFEEPLCIISGACKIVDVDINSECVYLVDYIENNDIVLNLSFSGINYDINKFKSNL